MKQRREAMTDHVVSIRPPFDELVRIANRRLEALAQWEKDREKETLEARKRKQVAAGQALLDLRAAIEAGEIGELATWWEWFDDNVRSIERRTAEKYMQIARASDPLAKAIELQKRNNEVQRLNRQYPKIVQQKQAPYCHTRVEPEKVPLPVVRATPPPTKYTTGPDDDELVAQVMALFDRMSWDARFRAAKEIDNKYKLWHRGEG
jgi:hypothetical protein